jgi:hypothetical protein
MVVFIQVVAGARRKANMQAVLQAYTKTSTYAALQGDVHRGCLREDRELLRLHYR